MEVAVDLAWWRKQERKKNLRLVKLFPDSSVFHCC